RADALRPWLAERLPRYMVPTAFVAMDRLPRLPSGKIDRARLPPPIVEAASGPEADAPATALERQLCDLLADVLGRKVGRTDNFFELGGHSLAAIQVVSRL